MTAQTPSSQTASGLATADFGTRFSAFMIDAALLFAGQWIVFIVLSRQLQAVGLTATEPCAPDSVQFCEGPSTALWTVLLLVLLISTVAYHAVFEGRYGATPGKRWMGLSVVSESDQQPIGAVPGLLRSLVRQSFWLSLFFIFDASPLGLSLPAALFIVLPMICFGLVAWAAVAPDGRGVHDVIAGTKVVRTDSLPARPVPTPTQGGDAQTENTADTNDSENSEESV